jgi:hypothetical protein
MNGMLGQALADEGLGRDTRGLLDIAARHALGLDWLEHVHADPNLLTVQGHGLIACRGGADD